MLATTVVVGQLPGELFAAHQAPPPRSRAEVEAVLAAAPKAPPGQELRPLNVVLLAGPKDHGINEHDYPLWQKRWKVLLGGKGRDDEPQVNVYGPPPKYGQACAGSPKVKVSTAWQWPSKEQMESADLIVMFCAPRWNPESLKDLETFLARGGGFVVVHMAIWQVSTELADLIGMAKGPNTRFRHGPVDLKITAPDHPICRGLPENVSFVDETYYYFQGDPSKITTLATCDEIIEGQNDARPEPMFWTCEQGKGRVFVCILGHFMWTFDDPYFRALLLRGMAWAAGESPYRFDRLILRGVPLVDKPEPGTAQASAAAEPPDPNDPKLLLWLDASDAGTLTVDADGHVSAWANKAAAVDGSLTSSGTQQPLYVAEALAGRPTLRFDGEDDALRNTNFDQTAQTWTLFVATTPRSNGGGFPAFFAANRTDTNDYRSGINLDMGSGASVTFDCINLEGAKHPGQSQLKSVPTAFNQGCILTVSTNNVQTRAFVNRSLQRIRFANDGVCSLQEVRVGARIYENPPGKLPLVERGYLDDDISELLFYQDELSAAERNAVHDYLHKKYGIAIEKTAEITLDAAFRELTGHQWGQSRVGLYVVDEAVRASHGDTKARSELEKRLLAVLEADATEAAKKIVCQHLSVIGSEKCVAALTTLLTDEEHSHFARFALERIGGEAAARALRQALSRTNGQQKVGLINSLGRLGDRAAVADLVVFADLVVLLADPAPDIAAAAAVALGRIGAPDAARPLVDYRAKVSGPHRADANQACIELGERLRRQGENDRAAQIFEQLQSDPAPQVRAAALGGLVRTRPDEAVSRLLKALADDDRIIRGAAMRIIRETPNQQAIDALVDSLGQLEPNGQMALVRALTARNDPSARPAALELLGSRQESLGLTALDALSLAGTADDVQVLVRLATSGSTAAIRDRARQGLDRLSGHGVDAAILALLPNTDFSQRVTLIHSVTARRLPAAVPALLEAAGDDDAAVRIEAFKALQILADAESATSLVKLLIRSPRGVERETAERALMACCSRITDPQRRADPILAALDGAVASDRCVLLPALGRIGGQKALEVTHAAMSDSDEQVRDAGVRALSNWPDASVAGELLAVARNAQKESHRVWALRAFARVVPLPSERSTQATFTMLKQAMDLARRTENKRLVLSRLAAVRVPDSLALALSCVDDTVLRAEAVAAAAELAEGMKDSHPEEALAAFERILTVTTDQRLREQVEGLLKKMDRRQ